MTEHLLKVKIYYEDTDCGGVVYYANYMRYFERARTEFFESKGVSLRKLMDAGIYFVVADASLRYLSPGRYGDILDIATTIDKAGPASVTFRHKVRREYKGDNLVEATVRLGCVGRDMKPLRMREDIMKAVTDEE
ncbi:MAG: YbgC/FadM family acyl-CoA thioesterase [Nitrospirota bacterium]